MVKKRFINIGTIGHVDHGKTTFTAAITKALHKRFPNCNKVIDFSRIDKAPEEIKRGITINATTITYETEKSIFSHTDCPGHADYIKNMITGSSQLDVAILIVNIEGPEVQTKEHILLAANLGIKHYAVFFNKVDMVAADDLETFLEMSKEEIINEMLKHKINLDNVQFFHGSALKALNGDEKELNNLADVICAIDNALPDPEREVDKPFLLAVNETFSITGRGTVVAGVVERGILNLNEEVEIVIPDKENRKTIATGIEMFNKSHNSCQAGDNVGVLLRGVGAGEIERGYLIAKLGTITKHTKAKVEIYILTAEEGGRHKPFTSGYKPQFFIRTGDYTGSISEMTKNDEKVEMILPGDFCTISVEFEKKIPFNVGTGVVVREGGRTIGQGKIIEVLN